MRLRTLLGELLPVMGTVGLLGLWLFQQTGIEARILQLRNLSAAHAVFHSYQSVSALFNAFLETTDRSNHAYEKIGLLRAYNWEAGLQVIEEALPPSAKDTTPTFYRWTPGTYVNGWPRFTPTYPKEWVERRRPGGALFQASSPGSVPSEGVGVYFVVEPTPLPLDKYAAWTGRRPLKCWPFLSPSLVTRITMWPISSSHHARPESDRQ